MPLSSVVGAQSIVKPGVCTSSTRPASPYDGQVIYETDTDKTLVYNGTGWVYLSTSRANPNGLDFITSASPSAAQTFSVSNCFSSTYDHYLVMFTMSAFVGADTSLYMRLRSSSTDATTNYASQRTVAYGASFAASTNPVGTDRWYLGFSNSTYPTSHSLSFQVFSPFATTASRYQGTNSVVEAANVTNLITK